MAYFSPATALPGSLLTRAKLAWLPLAAFPWTPRGRRFSLSRRCHQRNWLSFAWRWRQNSRMESQLRAASRIVCCQ